MRRIIASAIALLLALAPVVATAAPLALGLGQGEAVRLSGPARSVVVGDPEIADVSMTGPRDLVVLGRGYGVTSIVVTDPEGRLLFNRQVIVGGESNGEMAYVRGGETRAFSCAPVCRATGEPAQASPP